MFRTLTMVEKINKTYGEIVRGLQTEGSDPAVHNFSRNSASPEVLDSSFNEVRRALEAERIALPREFVPEANDRLINRAVDNGYVKGEDNPNPAGMGLVTSERNFALCTTWADAPAWVAVYIDPRNPAVRVIASGSGIWHLLRYGTLGQTVALIQSEVEQLEGAFDIQNLWVATSPGARAKGDWPFRLDEGGKAIVLSGASAGHADMVIKLENPTEEPERDDKPLREYALDLSGLVWELWLDQGVDANKLYFDDRTNGKLANKRAANAAGQTTWPSELIGISLL